MALARLALVWIRQRRVAQPVQPIGCVHCGAQDSHGALCTACNEPICGDCEQSVGRCQRCQRVQQPRIEVADELCPHFGPACQTCVDCASGCERCTLARLCVCLHCGQHYDPERVSYCRHNRDAQRLCQRCADACGECFEIAENMFSPLPVSDDEEADTNEIASGGENDDPNVN